ncbi:glycosyltransferase [Candidatus Kaiserbacteria bacterium]|nr:glycosyltransferase [Candidatus Kaiserbacteria bacterium]
MNPLVSVVIPTKNRPELLKRALTSVVAQTYKDFEAIVVDDGDGSAAAMVASFGDSRIRSIKNNGVHGGGAARNLGIREAKGEFVAFLDDDDAWVPEKLAVEVWFLNDASAKTAFVFSAVTNVRESGEETSNVPEGKANYLERALTRFSGFLTSTLLLRREALLAVGGFDESLPSHQEPDLIIRLSEKYDGISVDKPLTRMSMEESHEHIGSDLRRRVAGRKAILLKHAALFQARPRILAKHYFRIGLWSRDIGEKVEAKKYFRLAAGISFSLRYTAHYLLALMTAGNQ